VRKLANIFWREYREIYLNRYTSDEIQRIENVGHASATWMLGWVFYYSASTHYRPFSAVQSRTVIKTYNQ